MSQTACVLLDEADRVRLAEIVGDRSRPLKHVLRARIVLVSAERLPVLEVAERAGVSRPAVWRWQQRFGEEGVDGLLRDKTRPPGTPPHTAGTVAEVLALTCSEPPGEVTHWSGRAVAKAVGISLRSYSPDFNPIEMAFAKLKALLRKAAARTIPDLWQAIKHAIPLFTPQECANYFDHAGYEPA